MKKSALFLIAILAFLSCSNTTSPVSSENPSSSAGLHSSSSSQDEYEYTPDATLQNAFETQQSDLQVLIRARIIKLLSDDTVGDRHQRFIVELESGQTLLVAHNIDIAPRIEDLAVGDEVAIYGVYEWNDEGGVIHWTHVDPDGNHPEGWIREL
jgi:hypothetical protein